MTSSGRAARGSASAIRGRSVAKSRRAVQTNFRGEISIERHRHIGGSRGAIRPSLDCTPSMSVYCVASETRRPRRLFQHTKQIRREYLPVKSERRHELQHNYLADWLATAGKSINPYLNHIFLVGLAIIIAFLGYTWWSKTTTGEKSAAWNDYYVGLDTRDQKELSNVAEIYKGTTAANMATVLVGDYRLNNGCAQVFNNKAIGENDLTKAMRSYETIGREARDAMLLARAKFGLGRANESKCELEAAEQCYREVVAGWPDSAYAMMATERLDDLKRTDTKRFYDDFRAKYEANPVPADDLGIPKETPAFDESSLPSEESPDLPGLNPEDAAPAEPEKQPAGDTDK